MKYFKRVMICGLALILFPIEVVFSGFAGLIIGIGSAFESLLDVMTGEVE